MYGCAFCIETFAAMVIAALCCASRIEDHPLPKIPWSEPNKSVQHNWYRYSLKEAHASCFISNQKLVILASDSPLPQDFSCPHWINAKTEGKGEKMALQIWHILQTNVEKISCLACILSIPTILQQMRSHFQYPHSQDKDIIDIISKET